MLMQPLLKDDVVFVKSILDTKSAFGVSIYSGEKVFIPKNVTRRAGLSEGEEYDMKLAPNREHPENSDAPWFCIYAYPHAENEDVIE